MVENARISQLGRFEGRPGSLNSGSGWGLFAPWRVVEMREGVSDSGCFVVEGG